MRLLEFRACERVFPERALRPVITHCLAILVPPRELFSDSRYNSHTIVLYHKVGNVATIFYDAFKLFSFTGFFHNKNTFFLDEIPYNVRMMVE
ncbi:hypothetical protein NCCP2331_03850 [Sporosarcina sp. NCCP-2331]|nr:hypothetical protein NCCP2331_03850 [Sporosarcina sp. NCCP-2331]